MSELKLARGRPAAADPTAATIHQLFRRQAAARPDAVAAVCGEEVLTYGELDRRAGRLAHRLRQLGVGPEVLVALVMERGLDCLTALLAILEAGGAYVPLDPDYPRERLAYMLEVAGCSLLVAEEALLEDLPELTIPVLCPAREAALVAALPETPPALPEIDGESLDGESLAYVNFTSGSTGKPKAVAVPHRAVVRLVTDPDWVRLGPQDTVLQFAPLSFDAATFEVWGTLTHGARLAVVPPGRPSLEDLARHLTDSGVTVAWLTAGLFHQLVESHPQAFSGLRWLLAGGDVLSVPHVRRALELVRGAGGRVVNGYGPTEGTTFTTCQVLEPGCELAATVPIGRAIQRTRTRILAPDLTPLDGAVGALEGQLGIGGDGLARGYLGRPAATAEVFVPDPAATRPGERLYLSGDLVRRRADGVHEFLGRIDDQVKVRGFRVEPGEIESVLSAHPAVGQAAVLALPAESGAAGDKRLVAYVAVGAAEGSVAAPELRAFLAAELPEWMVPAAFVILPELPLNPNGKVDRGALARHRPGSERPEVSTPFVAPATQLEGRVAAVFAEMLGLDRVGMEDDLFELGGHSLAATRIVTRLREMSDVEVPMGRIFEAPTAAAAAAWIEQHGSAGDAGDAAAGIGPPVPRPAGFSGDLPLAFPQERIWFLQKLDPDSLAYNFQARLTFRGALSVAALRAALEAVVARHEVFRTAYPARQGRPVQEIHPPAPVPLPRVDLTALPAERREAEAWRAMRRIYRRPYDVSRLPLVYWVLFRLRPQEHWLLHGEHHLIHDGWSFNVFLEDFAAYYRSFVTGRPAELPDMPVQFADFALWQRQWDGSDDYHRQLEYWKRQLAGELQTVQLPLDHPRPPAQTFRGDVLRRELPGPLAAELRRFARGQGSTLFMTLLSAFFTLLHRYGGQTDFCIGSGIANRRFAELERLVGMVINTVVLRGDLSGDPPFSELLRRVGDTTRQAYANQDVPLDRVVEAVRPQRDASFNPLFQVLLGFHDAPLADLGLPGVELETLVGLPNGSAKFDLNLVAILPREQKLGQGSGGEDAVELLWELNTDLFEPATVERLLAHFRNLLAGVVEDPDTPLSRLPMLADAERRQLVHEWGGPASGYPRDGALNGLLRTSFERWEGEVALETADGVTWTYGELQRRAQGLAAELVARGVGPEVPVALFLDRSPEAVAAIAAVILAGGAYVPLETGFPAERLTQMLHDSAARLLLTRRELADRLPPDVPPVILLDELPERDAAPVEPRPTTPDQLAYVMFTSGSTGRPKPVGIGHRGVLRLVSDPNFIDLGPSPDGGRVRRLRPQDVVLHTAPLGFDASTLEIWMALAHGARVLLAPSGVMDTAVLGDLIVRRGVSWMFLTTGLFHQMVETVPESLAGVGQLYTGGDVISPVHVRRVLDEMPQVVLTAAYGPTENTVFSSTSVLREAELPDSIPLGTPLSDGRLYVLDSHLQPLPPGAVGEIFASGDGVARGYLGRPARTAVSFLPDPFCGEGGIPAGERMYATGDLGRWLPDGRLMFGGRRDQQVKIRGYRIEPGEVEVALAAHPAVQQAVVLVLGTSSEDKRLVAFAVPAPGAETDDATLGEYLRRRLPPYMVPSVLRVVDAIPRTDRDKFDRRALAELAAEATNSGDDYVAPRNEIEEVLVRVWSELIDAPRIGVRDNFFELGGHSLHATRHMFRIRELLEIELPVRALYEAPTIEQLAVQVEERLLEELEGMSDAEVEGLVE